MGNKLSGASKDDDEDDFDLAKINSENIVATKSMFALKQAIGKSQYGMVWKAVKKSNKREYAVKVMDKATIFNLRSVDCILNEHKILTSIRTPFIVNIHYAFQDVRNVYLVSPFMQGGDLRYHMETMKKR
jgi:serine/threonine protein kinase